MEKKSSSSIKWWIIIGLLLIGLGGLGFYSYKTQKEHQKINEAIQEEKNEIAGNLDNMIVKYEDAISQNTSLSTELEVERDRVIVLRDSIKRLKRVNYSLIKKYRKQIANLQLLNQRLFRKNDSLISLSKSLSLNLEKEKEKVAHHQSRIDTLTKRNYELEGKVTVGSILQADKFTVTPLKERSSGKLVSTSRARRVSAFRIGFFIKKNIITNKGKRIAYVQVKNKEGEVLGEEKGMIELNTGDRIQYSDKIEFNYNKEEIEVIVLPKVVKGTVLKGFVDITVYIEGALAGGTMYKLKY